MTAARSLPPISVPQTLDEPHPIVGLWLADHDKAVKVAKRDRSALRQRKATPAEIAKYAVEAGIWEKVVQPRLEVLTVDA
jgi:hypothetical protein